MKGVSSFLAHLIMILTILSLFPIVYYSLLNPARLENIAVSEHYRSVKSSMKRKLDIMVINSTLIAAYNYGEEEIAVRCIYVDGLETSFQLEVYVNGTWINSMVIPSGGLALIRVDTPVTNEVVVVDSIKAFRFHV